MPYRYTRPPGWAKLRQRILYRDQHTCYRCGRQADEVDHIIGVTTWTRQQLPGNPHHPDNLAAICTNCHRAKSDRERREGQQHRPSRNRPTEPHPGRLTA